MTRRRRFLLIALGTAVLLAVVVLVRKWHWVAIGLLYHEHFYDGKPTSYWRAAIQDAQKPLANWVGSVPASVRGVVGWGVRPAVLSRDPEAVPVLLDLLADEDPKLRFTALHCLLETPDLPANVPESVMVLLNDEVSCNRRVAAFTLAKICSDESIVVPALVPLLREEDLEVRRSIAHTLAWLGPKSKQALPALCERLRDRGEDAVVRSDAARALGGMREAATPAVSTLGEVLMDATGQVRVEAATALWRITKDGDKVLPVLLHSQEDRNAAVRQKAASSLGELGADVLGTVPALLVAVADPEAGVRWVACEALGRIGPEAREAVLPLARLIREEQNARTLNAAVRAVGRIGPGAAPAVPALTTLLDRQNQFLRAEVARALAAIGSGARDAVPALLANYQRGEPPNLDREAVAMAIRQIDPEAAEQNGIP
jgi:HEAT repeat protein